MPWKNGQGQTTEIVSFPPGSTLDELAPGSTVHLQHPATAHVVHALRGAVSVRLSTFGLPLSTPDLVTLSPGDTWLLTAEPDEEAGFEFSAAGAGAVAILVSISPTSTSATSVSTAAPPGSRAPRRPSTR